HVMKTLFRSPCCQQTWHRPTMFPGKRASHLISFAGPPGKASTSSRLGREAQHVTTIDSDHDVDRSGVRLQHAPESDFSQFNDPIVVEDKIQAGVEDKPIDRNQGWRLPHFVSRASACGF